MRKAFICGLTVIIIFIAVSSSTGQTVSDSIRRKPNYKRIGLVCSAVPISTASVYYYMNHVWWHSISKGFHINDDQELRYALNLDKFGHFYSTIIVSEVFADLLRFSGLSENGALWGGATFSIINAAIVEIKDGFSPYWGFSKYDMCANISGSLYPVLQNKVPFFRNINFKWSYDFIHPSYYKSLPRFKDKSFIDDYERHTYWTTFNIAGIFFRENRVNYFPRYIDFAIGMSARGLDGKGAGTREWFVGVDVNLRKIGNNRKNLWYYSRKYLNFYHFPTPTARVYP